MRQTYVSVPWGAIYPPPADPDAVVSLREVDWGLRPIRRRLLHVTGALRLAWRARKYDRLVVCTIGSPLLVTAVAKQVVARRTELVAVDFLRPPSAPAWLLRIGLRLVDRFVVVRGGDVELLVGLGCPRERCSFVKFPAPDLTSFAATVDISRHDRFVYAGGTAQRDWATLFESLRRAGVPAVVSCPEPPVSVPSNVQVVGNLSPEHGRSWLARSQFLVLAVYDNDLPSGPLVLLDAFALGRGVVATNANGTRDYIRDGKNGVLVPPGDPAALAEAIRAHFADPDRVAAYGCEARATAAELTADLFWSQVLA